LSAGFDFHEAKASIPGTGNQPISLTSWEDIGRYVAAILKNPDITENKNMHFARDMQTTNSLLAMYERQLGKKLDVTYRSAEEIDGVAKDKRKNGNLAVYLKSHIPYFLVTGVSCPLPGSSLLL
jgi:NmrA-like family